MFVGHVKSEVVLVARADLFTSKDTRHVWRGDGLKRMVVTKPEWNRAMLAINEEVDLDLRDVGDKSVGICATVALMAASSLVVVEETGIKLDEGDAELCRNDLPATYKRLGAYDINKKLNTPSDLFIC
ncbi:hypothetical protein H9P43_010186 [Blastocladiella emersonii ATCC 22665]|nr:hypothetical protein H9P43_010171 [Blastocladiella emersonii ATCC 22665]KAI9148515.1 hypothetical protein H9P43_010186 [Blastocladiella emersonii ATCC 22665]